MADASISLRERNFASALSLYERVLAQDSDNAEALYGAANAAIGLSGLNIGVLLSNISDSASGAPAFSDLADLIGQSRLSVSAAVSNPNSLLYGIDVDGLNAYIDTAICRMRRITTGATDGGIGRDDVDVILNLAALYVIRAVLRPVRLELLDIVRSGGSYDVVVDANLTANVCDGTSLVGGMNQAEQLAFIQAIAQDVASAYTLFNRVVTLLNLDSSRVVSRLLDDVGQAASDLLVPGGGPGALPQECIDTMDAGGVNLGNFNSYSAPISMAPTGC